MMSSVEDTSDISKKVLKNYMITESNNHKGAYLFQVERVVKKVIQQKESIKCRSEHFTKEG